jgi:hypothetical protein
MRIFSSILIMIFTISVSFIAAQTSTEIIGTWKPSYSKRYENGILVKQGKLNPKRKIYINNDGTMEYRYTRYMGFFNHGIFPHTSKRPSVNRYKLVDTTINVYWEHPHKLPKGAAEEKPIDKITIHKLTNDTLILVFKDAYTRVYTLYLRTK